MRFSDAEHRRAVRLGCSDPLSWSQRCTSEAGAYNDCLKQHGGQSNEQLVQSCKEALKMLHDCTHRRLSQQQPAS